MNVDQAAAIIEMDAEGDGISLAAKVLLAEVKRQREQLASAVNGPWLDLADEVMRLRAENEHLSTFGPLRRLNDEWQAKFARVKALAEKWSEASYHSDHLACLRDLETALRGSL